MAKKDPEAARMSAEQNRAEMKRLMADIRTMLNKVPPSVVNGSHNHAVAFKESAKRAYKLLSSARPTLVAVRSSKADLERFYKK